MMKWQWQRHWRAGTSLVVLGWRDFTGKWGGFGKSGAGKGAPGYARKNMLTMRINAVSENILLAMQIILAN